MIQTHLTLFFLSKLVVINSETIILKVVEPNIIKFVENIFPKSLINIFKYEHITLSRE